MQTWRRKGPLGKLDNIVVYVQRSPQRVAAFLKLSSGKCLVRDNKARWNSWYATIDCAIQERMRLAIDLFCLQRGNDSGADSLSHEDWIVLTDIHRLLSFFHQATLATEGQRATIERILSTMELPLEQLELGKLEYIEGSYIRPCNDSAWTNTMFYQRGLLVLLNQGQLTGCQISSRSGSMQSPPHHEFEDVRDWLLASEYAMSAPPEHLFASCKTTPTDRRNKLSVRVIEALECLRSWYQVQKFDLEDVEEECKK